MLAILFRVLPVLILVALAAAVLPTTPRSASLAGDAGLDDAGVCASVTRDAGVAIARLDASGFPHATTSRVELYRLVRDDGLRLQADGSKARVLVTEAQVRIDWTARSATCLPDAYTGPVDATIVLTPHAYAALVGELRHVIETGHGSIFSAPGRWISLTVGTSVHIPGNEQYEGAYKRSVAVWAAGAAARGLA